MEQGQHFTSIIPCQISESSNNIPFSCTLVLEFSKSKVQFNLFKENSRDTAPVQFEYNKYNKLLISTSRCIFINVDNGISATFFFFCSLSDGYTNNNLRRFVFALADAGMLIPDNDEHYPDIQNNYSPFIFIPVFSFVPDGFYNFTNHLIHRNVRKILMNRIVSIQNKKDLPLNPTFFNLAFDCLHDKEEQNIIQSKEKNAKKISLNFVFTHHLKILNKVITKFYDQKSYKRFKNEIEKAESISQYSIYFQMIETDCQEFNSKISNIYNRNPDQVISQIYKEKWNKKMSNLCMNVCKTYVISHNAAYYENNFIIAIKIALLLKNGEKLESLAELSNGKIRKEIETFSKGVNSIISRKTNDEFEAIVYSIYSVLMGALTQEIISNFGYDFSMRALNYFAPTSHAYFILKNIQSFKWLEEDIKEIFLFTFKNPWIFWFFIMRTKNSEKAVEAIVASIVYHFTPKLVKQEIENESALKDSWSNFVLELQSDTDLVKNIVDIASFFYSYHGIIVQNE